MAKHKAKYYATCDFLQEKLGHNPSFIWRSILEAKNLLMAGARWWVGNGKSIKILDHPWLMLTDHPYITSDPQALQDSNVDALLCMDRKKWDVEVIGDVLNDRDREAVMAIQLNDSWDEDVLYWRFEESGVYSVKSAYKWLQVQGGSWNVDTNDTIWRSLWSIKAPPKALNLVWRALSGCLPTLTQLQVKKVLVENICLVCHFEPETTLHSLVLCHAIKQCWSILL